MPVHATSPLGSLELSQGLLCPEGVVYDDLPALVALLQVLPSVSHVGVQPARLLGVEARLQLSQVEVLVGNADNLWVDFRDVDVGRWAVGH